MLCAVPFQVMEELLAGYKGVLLVVSHDRRFMQTLTDRLFVLEGDGYVRLFDGLYNEVRGLYPVPFSATVSGYT